MIDTFYDFLTGIWDWLKGWWPWLVGLMAPGIALFVGIFQLVEDFISNIGATLASVAYHVMDGSVIDPGVVAFSGEGMVSWGLSFIDFHTLGLCFALVITAELVFIGVRVGIAIYKLIPLKAT